MISGGRRLLAKLSLTFAVFALISVASVGVLVSISIKAKYGRMVRESDVAVAGEMSGFLGEYYDRNGGWDGLDRQLGALPQFRMPGRRFMPGRTPVPGRSEITMLVMDQSGNAVFDSRLSGEKAFPPKSNGVPIYRGGANVGYVFVGTMLGTPLSPADRAVIRSLNVSIFVYAIIVAAIAVVLGALMAMRIEKPIRALATAAMNIADGDLTTRVSIDSRDEIGVLGERFNNMAASLQQADDFRKRLIADTAHELRTPVSLIQGRLELIAEGIYTADDEMIGTLLEETKSLSVLINDMRVLADAEAGTLPMNMCPESLPAIAHACAELFAPIADERSVNIVVDVSDTVPEVSADRGKIRQIYSNLLANALSHSPDGSTITIRISVDKGYIVSRFIDHGSGIDEELQGRIFERFSKAGGPGSGLGLAISAEIARLHKGNVELESTGPNGSVFAVKIPIPRS